VSTDNPTDSVKYNVQRDEKEDFLAAIKNADVNCKTASETQEDKTSGIDLIGTSLEGLKLMVAAKIEVYMLLSNDSYQRFLSKPLIQSELKQYREFLFVREESRKRGDYFRSKNSYASEDRPVIGRLRASSSSLTGRYLSNSICSPVKGKGKRLRRAKHTRESVDFSPIGRKDSSHTSLSNKTRSSGKKVLAPKSSITVKTFIASKETSRISSAPLFQDI